MTRSEQTLALAAAIAGSLLALAAPCRAAGSYPPSAELDLSRLTFAPSLTTGTAPASSARQPEAGIAKSDRASRARTERPIAAQLDAIRELEVRDGFFSAELADELRSLAALYQERGEHDIALGLLDRAQQIVRFNEGLFSLGQAPMIRQATASREALQQPGAPEHTRSELLALARRNPNDPRASEIYNDVANVRLAEVEHYFNGDPAPLLDNGLTKGGAFAPVAPYTFATISSGGIDPSYGEAAPATNPDGVLYGLGPVYVDLPPVTQLVWRALRSARRNYNDAIYSVLRNPSADGPSLTELEAGLVRTYYVEAQNLKRLLPFQSSPAPQRAKLHALGTNTYVRTIRRSEEQRSPSTEIAAELLALGDWHLVFGAKELAFEAYRGARDMLVRDRATTEQLAAFFSPTAPVVLPTFAAGYVDPSRADGYQGYVGVEIALDDVGKSVAIDVTERSVAATDAIVQKLKKHVAKSVFRPRFYNGEWLGTDRVALRYYFSY